MHIATYVEAQNSQNCNNIGYRYFQIPRKRVLPVETATEMEN